MADTEELINRACALGSTTIDLSRKNLTQIPKEVLELKQLEFLYLQGNCISSIPEDLFGRLSCLRWLDLRNNRLSKLPSVVGEHRNLRNLLLEGNNIKMLPLELGFAKSLSGLNLTGNPLEFPPPQVIERGTQEVLKFLREHYLEQIKDKAETHLIERSDSSSSEELSEEAPPQSNIKRLHARGGPFDDQWGKEKAFIESVKLPPIIQAAVRPRDRSTEETQDLLRGHKAMQFEQEKRERVKNPPTEDQHYRPIQRQKKPTGAQLVKKDVSNKSAVREYTRPIDMTRQKLQSDENMKKIIEVKNEEKASHGDAKKSKIRKKKNHPQKEDKSAKQNNVFTNPASEVSTKQDDVANCEQLEGVSGYEHARAAKAEGVKHAQRVTQVNMSDQVAPHKPWSWSVEIGDMVALKVPDKLYIKGQPCLGKVTCLADRTGFITVHYYTGSYSSSWRPMMSRTSPYLRKVPLINVMCKFHLTADGRMSPITAAKVRKTIDTQPEMDT